MAAKRFFSESGSDPDDQPPEKRMRARLASVIGEVVMVNSLKNFCSALEPMLRRVVNEEVERSIMRCTRSLARVPSLRIQALEPSSLELKFSKNLTLPIFTGSKIVDSDSSPLQIFLADTRGGDLTPVTLSSPVKVEIVVLDGDFPPGDRNNWTSEEFNNNVVRERQGKRPLLAGELNVTMRNNGVISVGDIELTDNSSWIRSRKFRLGARVSSGSYQGVRIREAMTEAFVVKDHRGELYKKHYPPQLGDEVWRLEKIGKEGAFHKKLGDAGIKTVQDFLKMSVIDPVKLRSILGTGMSEKIWEATIKHARTCELGNKRYIFQGPSYSILLNPICQVERAVIDEQVYTNKDLTNNINRAYIERLVRQAFSNWHTLQEVEVLPLNGTAQITQGEAEDQSPIHPNNSSMIEKPYPLHQQGGYSTERGVEVEYMANNEQLGGNNDWQITSAFVTTPYEHVITYSITESPSDHQGHQPHQIRSLMGGN